MMAALIRALLAVEIVCYGGVALWLGLPAWGVAAVIVAGILLFHVLIVLRGFYISGRYTTEPPEVRRLSLSGWCQLISREWASTVLLYTVLQPWQRMIDPPEPRSAKGIPVLLVHGLVCNSGAWWWMRRQLRRHGVGRTYTINLEPIFSDIDVSARQLAERVQQICAQTGEPKILIIAHSMGGLVSRACLHRYGGEQRIAGLLTVGSPHHGTMLARTLPIAENIRQMQPGNPWLNSLNQFEHGAAPIPITSVYSAHDNLVSPQASARLAHAENVRLRAVGHVSLLFSRELATLATQFVASYSRPTQAGVSTAAT
jgi:pimeloyl-ACP methyl ester carboxylesterase